MALPDVVGFAAALVAVVTAASIVRGIFRRTIGARWVAQRRVEALAARTRHAYFVEQLGEPALMAEGTHLGAELGVGAGADQDEVDHEEDELVGKAEQHARGTPPPP